MTSILEKIDNYLTEATKPTFEEFLSKNMKMVQRYWEKRKGFHESNYEDEDDGSSGMLPEQEAENDASDDTIKKFKSKFAFNSKDVDEYIEFLIVNFGG